MSLLVFVIPSHLLSLTGLYRILHFHHIYRSLKFLRIHGVETKSFSNALYYYSKAYFCQLSGSSVAIGNALQTARYEIQNHEEEDLKHTNYKMVWLYSSGKNTAGLYDPFEEIQKLKDNYKSGGKLNQTDATLSYLSHIMRKPVYAVYEQQRRRSSYASAKSDQSFIVHCLDSIMYLVSLSEISSL